MRCCFNGNSFAFYGDIQGGHRVKPLAGHAQCFTTGRKNFQMGTGQKEVGHESCCPLDEVLNVVQYNQGFFIPYSKFEPFEG